MSEAKSDKSLLRGVNAGTASGAEKVNREFRQKLHALADRGMDNRLRRREDPEDIVQSVLGTVFRRAVQGQLHFEHTSELWRLLEAVTRHKIIKHAEHHKAKKRTPKGEEYEGDDALLDREPTPDEQAVAKDLSDRLLEGLDQSYSKIALLLKDGQSERAIAEQLGCTRSAVTTKIGRLRKRLQTLLEEDTDDRVER
jgi:RNA polymerase sigma factor (sigma-70 family)